MLLLLISICVVFSNTSRYTPKNYIWWEFPFKRDIIRPLPHYPDLDCHSSGWLIAYPIEFFHQLSNVDLKKATKEVEERN